MIHETLIPFLWLIIPLVALVAIYKVRTNYKIVQMKTQDKLDKKEQTVEGSINKFFHEAPATLDKIDSELATLKAQAIKERLTPEQTKKMLGRLQSERDMLVYAVKYGDMIKPFVKPIDKIVNRLLSGFTGER